MRKFGLIGYPLSHSFSPAYFKEKFEKKGIYNCEYKAYALPEIHMVNDLFTDELCGLNVTIPYKTKVIPFLDRLDTSAEKIGAVNTILYKDGEKIGYNTDAYGFQMSLQVLVDGTENLMALILGTGGASKAVAFVLEELGIAYSYVSRNDQYLTYTDINNEILNMHKLIINTTPLGTFPNVYESADLPYCGIGKKHFLYDLVYNPEKTLFLTKGEINGAKIKNGRDMLHLQAEKSWEIWNQF